VCFAEYRLFHSALLQKKPMILRSQLIVATSCLPSSLRISTRYQAYNKKQYQRITSVHRSQSKNIKYMNKDIKYIKKEDQRYIKNIWKNTKYMKKEHGSIAKDSYPGRRKEYPHTWCSFCLKLCRQWKTRRDSQIQLCLRDRPPQWSRVAAQTTLMAQRAGWFCRCACVWLACPFRIGPSTPIHM